MEPEVQTPPASAPAPEPTLAEHEAQYATPEARAKAKTAPAAAAPAGTEDAPSSDVDDAAAGDRDEAGRFKPGRHRAKSQQAGPADVPRIAELTRKLRETEARLADIEARTSRPAPTPAPEPKSPPPAPIELPAGFPPEPKPEDFPDDVLKYVAAQARWAAKAEIALENIARERHEAERSRTQTFVGRVNDAKAKYDDFEAVALNAPTRIPPGSAIDHYVMEHKAGAELLYHFQKNPDDLDRVLGLSALDQIDALSLLAQRLTAPPSRKPDASTGSPAAPQIVTGPRPPNPVRTGPMKSGDDPPGDEASILEHERYFNKARVR